MDKELKECATILHKILCTHDHTDRCDWYYDDGSWSRKPRQRYLSKAKIVLKKLSIQELRKLEKDLNYLKEVKDYA